MSIKLKHEIRDPIHGFVKILPDERIILNSIPVQRLRDINQLALTYLLYPSATHKRFEHSLGVMELATKVFDVITASENINPQIREILPEISDEDAKSYWRRVVRIAALCHDVGHLPFSHAGEAELFPSGWDHEKMTLEIIEKNLKDTLEEMSIPIRSKDVVKIALGLEKVSKFSNWSFSVWETILSEIIVGDAFGVDRMDYLLRDSQHIGVAYGKFDHFRLIDTLRILSDSDSTEPKLGIEIGGLHVAESLLLARFFMFSQVYFHHVRRIYDIHLKEFLKDWLISKRSEPVFPTDQDEFLTYSDSRILVDLYDAAKNESLSGHIHAKRIIGRNHFKLLYERNPADIESNPEAVSILYEELQEKYGNQNVSRDESSKGGGIINFPIVDRNGEIISSLSSDILKMIPPVPTGFIFINPEYKEDSLEWLKNNKLRILKEKTKVIDDE